MTYDVNFYLLTQLGILAGRDVQNCIPDRFRFKNLDFDFLDSDNHDPIPISIKLDI